MFYMKSIEQSLQDLECTKEGLSTKEAKVRFAHYGKNSLPKAQKRTLLDIFIDQFKSPVIYILLCGATLSLVLKDFSDASFIFAALLMNALVGTHQEYRAGERADALKQIIKTYATVLRDGHKIEVESENITLGDILFFESGGKVPADIRLIETQDLLVNESLLSGESIEVRKDASYLSSDADATLGERKNMLYGGSMVTKGRAVGVVCAIGSMSEVGKIASLLAKAEAVQPPLILRMQKFSLNIAKIVAVTAVLIIAIGIFQEFPLKEIFFITIALAVSAIPEGLPVAITVALSVASSAMSRRNVIVRKLSAIEGLGSCTLIASDKTGTMTQNLLSVAHFVTPKKSYSAHEYSSENILLGAILCNEASWHTKDKEIAFMGDQVDVALAQYVRRVEKSLFEKYGKLEPCNTVPYEPINKYSGAAYLVEGKKMHFIKGSPEIILGMCIEEDVQNISNQVNMWAARGFRTIALACKESDEAEIAKEGYSYLGFAAITDPLREGVVEALIKAKEAGIEVVMITGDHPNTAYFIAKELGIILSRDEVMDGSEISHAASLGIHKEEIANKRVFARVSPEQKQLIVKTFQELGHFVAVTGDGANDAPALKYANISIAMGKSGTDVARESSDLILTDDSFASIINGVEEGRVAYDNIRKVIHLLMSTSFAEVVLVLLSMLFFIPLPLLPVQILWLNLVANGFQDVALGLEKAEPNVLKRKPRDPKEPIFNRIMISRIVVGGLYMGVSAFGVFYTLLEFGYEEAMARNITLLLMVLFENVHAFNSRTEKHSIFKIDHKKNKILWLSILSAQGIHIASMYIPFMQSLLHIQPVSLEVWGALLCIALLLIVVMESEKVIRRSL